MSRRPLLMAVAGVMIAGSDEDEPLLQTDNERTSESTESEEQGGKTGNENGSDGIADSE